MRIGHPTQSSDNPSVSFVQLPWHECLVAIAASLGLTVCYLHLTLDRFLTSIAPDRGDPLFNLAILRWGAHQARLGFPDLWNPTFFFPTRGVLALSDHLLGPAIGLAILQALGLPPAAGYNVLFLLAFAGSAFTGYMVLRWSGLGWAGAAVGALIWSFAGFRWQELSHLQVLLALWVPLVLWHFDRLLTEPTPKRALFFLTFYLLHISGGAYLAYLVHLPLAALVAVRTPGRWRDWLKRRSLGVLGAVAAIAGGAYLALYLPYRQWHGNLRAMDSFALVRPYLTGLFSWFQVGQRSIHAEWLPQAFRSETTGLFPGFLPLSLFAIGLWAWRRKRLGSAATLTAPVAARGLLALKTLALVAGVAALAAADFVTLTFDFATYPGFRDARRIYYACAAVAMLAALLWWHAGRRSPRGTRSDLDLWWTGLLAGGGLAFFASLAAGTMVFRALLPGFTSIRVPGRLFVFSSLALAALAGKGLDLTRRSRERRGSQANRSARLSSVLSRWSSSRSARRSAGRRFRRRRTCRRFTAG